MEDVPHPYYRIECHDYETEEKSADTPTIDIHEAFWSPVDKESANPLLVVAWVASTLLRPFKAAVRWRAKTIGDLLQVAALLAVALIYFGVTLKLLSWIVPVRPAPAEWFAFGLIAVGTYFALIPPAAFISRVAGFAFEYREMLRDAGEAIPFALAVCAIPFTAGFAIPAALAFAIAILCFRYAGSIAHEHYAILFHDNWLVALGTFVLLISGALIAWRGVFYFVPDVFGDLYYYATYDENDKRYAFREKVINICGNAILRLVRQRTNGRDIEYDRLIILGHSLGSSVAVDAIVNVLLLKVSGGLCQKEWSKINALVTFGTAVPKTDAYFVPGRMGRVKKASMATFRRTAFRGSITQDSVYWRNLWYFSDLVAEPIVPADFEMITGHALNEAICDDRRLRSPRMLWPHGRYLVDSEFWRGKGDVAKLIFEFKTSLT